MKFKHVLNCNSKIKRKNEYTFNGIERYKEQILKATYDKPFLFKDGFTDCLGYVDDGKITIKFMHTFDVFEEIKP